MASGKKKAAASTEVTQLSEELAPARAEGAEVLTFLGSLVITSTEHAQQIRDFVAQVKVRRVWLEAKRDSILDPLKATKKAIEAVFGPVIDTYEAAEKAGQGAIMRAMQEQAARERAALAEVATTGNAAPVLAVVEGAIAKPQGFTIRTTRVAEIIDRDACMEHLCKLWLAGFREQNPLTINEVALRRMEHSDAEQISGVKVVEKQTSVVS